MTRARLIPIASLVALLATPALTPAQATPTLGSSRIVFTFEHPQLQPSQYTIAIDETGTGRFESKPGPVTDPTADIFPTPLDRPILLDDTLRADLFRYARDHQFFATRCSAKKTSLAFTGTKTISYSGPDGRGSCTFVWAEDPALQRLADQLGAVAFTLEEGRRLDLEVRHDRLGLDAELASLQDALKDHRAADLPNIAEQLHAIADDQQVMDRARKRALALLASSESPQKTN
jgi:hypothetical protein